MAVKNLSSQIYFTNHAKAKMRFYHLSEQRVRRVLHSPKRIEEGIAPGTVAMMQSSGSGKRPHEIWIMIQSVEADKRGLKPFGEAQGGRGITRKKTKIISAWRYPGITKSGQPLPEEILREMRAAV